MSAVKGGWEEREIKNKEQGMLFLLLKTINNNK